MIEGLERLPDDQPGSAALRGLVEEMLGGASARGRLVSAEKLKGSKRVHRLRFEIEGMERALVVKPFGPERSIREQRLVERWLPAVGLEEHGPPLVATAADRTGRCVWHAYADLGDCELEGREFDAPAVRSAVELVANVHMRFADHPLLGECRVTGSDLGGAYLSACVRDATRSLEALCPPRLALLAEEEAVRHLLLERLVALRAEMPLRVEALTDWGGPETLVHGDPRPTNLLVSRLPVRPHARLVDWDHVGVGPVAFDVSVLLLRFPPVERTWVLERYREAVVAQGWELPDGDILNLLFDSAESARLASCVIWPATALLQGRQRWAFDELAEIAEWFDSLAPVLPEPEEAMVGLRS